MGKDDKQFCPTCFQEFYLAHCPIGTKKKITQPPTPVQPIQNVSAAGGTASGSASGPSAGGSSAAAPGQTPVGAMSYNPNLFPEPDNTQPPAPGDASAQQQASAAASLFQQEQTEYDIREPAILQPLFAKPSKANHSSSGTRPLPITTPSWWHNRKVHRLDGEYRRWGAKRLCPHCQYALPDDYGFIPAYIILVIGDRGSGKSLYFASMIQHFETAKSGLRCLLEPADAEISKQYKRYYEGFIENNNIILGNKQATDRKREPFVFIWSANQRAQEAYFLFYDVSGQDLANLDRVIENHPQVEYANALIFLADPVHMKGIQEHLLDRLKPIPLPPGEVRQADHTLLFQLTRHIERLKNQETLKIPVAVMMPKSDVLEHAVDSQMKDGKTGKLSEELPITQKDVTYDRLPSRKEFREINKEVQTFLQKRGEGALVQVARQLNLKAHFFATSATSVIPDPLGTFPANKHPRRTLDPILWILGQLGLVKIPANEEAEEEEEEY